MGKTILEMIDIKKSFSGIYALSGINFSQKRMNLAHFQGKIDP